MFCFWEKPSQIDIYYETGCHKEYSSDGDDSNIKKCPFCNGIIVFLPIPLFIMKYVFIPIVIIAMLTLIHFLIFSL